MPVFFQDIGAVLSHPATSLLPSQFARKPSRRTGFERIRRQPSCLGMSALTAFEGAVLEAARSILNPGCHHPGLAPGAARALDREKFWIGPSHGALAEDQAE
jgi:hypothetical protein